MSGTRCVALVALYVGLAQSWDIAATHGNVLKLYDNGNVTNSTRFESVFFKVLVYDEIHDKLLYAAHRGGGARICSYDISSNENLCRTKVDGRHIHGLAYDPATELLFFSDTNRNIINWISLKHGLNNNSNENLLIHTGGMTPTDLAVDSCRGYVYWINENRGEPTIKRAAFNGSMTETVLKFSGLPPHSLVIDQLTQKMYYIKPQNRSVSFIWYTDLNGGNPTFLKSITGLTDYSRPLSNTLTVSKSFLYWMDWCFKCETLVWKLPKTSSNSTDSYANFSLGWYEIFSRSIVAKYKIIENYQNIQDCEPLTNLVRNNSAGVN